MEVLIANETNQQVEHEHEHGDHNSSPELSIVMPCHTFGLEDRLTPGSGRLRRPSP